jgi:hypothetical protein
MTTLVVQAAWALLAAFLLSLVYEIYRATAKAGTSRHDSMDSFVKNNVVLYVVAAVVIGLLFVGFDWAPMIGLVFSVVVIVASIFFYNPRIMLDRQPGVVDWFEDMVFTGLVFVGAALLLYQVLGVTLEP